MPLVNSPKPISTVIVSDRGIAAVEVTAEICPGQHIVYSCKWTKIPTDVEVVFHGHVELLKKGRRVLKSAKFYTKSTSPSFVFANTGVPGERSQYVQSIHLLEADDGVITNPSWSERPLGY